MSIHMPSKPIRAASSNRLGSTRCKVVAIATCPWAILVRMLLLRMFHALEFKLPRGSNIQTALHNSVSSSGRVLLRDRGCQVFTGFVLRKTGRREAGNIELGLSL